jgi:4-alpha-glucanotransferase
MNLPRASGILLHPTSLPGKWGVGDIGEEAFRFVDFLVASEQSYWQFLPLGPTGFGNSPYQCLSAFAGNPLLISPEKLMSENLLSEGDIGVVPKFPANKADYGPAINFKERLLEKAFENFKRTTDTNLRADFLGFCQQSAMWLENYALYRALKDAHGGTAWSDWEPELVNREPKALAEARERLHDSIEAHKFYQFIFFKQWSQLKAYCHEHRIRLIGDIPIFVAYDSADMWMHPELFKLDEFGAPLVVAGVPPDYFSVTGQLWGNPIFNWDYMRASGYQWWIERIRGLLKMVDIVRIDHFRGFAACWEIPFGDPTAERGRWVEVPGRELFTALKHAFGELPIIAEDLGVITPDVEELRDHFGFPGMRVLQMAFRDQANHDLPHNYIQNAVVYTGTHDNDTAVGWFESEAGIGSTRDAAQIEQERKFCMEYLNSPGEEINWDFIRAALASVATTAIIPMQDVMGLDSSARMNLPASAKDNWDWRFKSAQLTGKLSNRLRKLTELYGRARS